MTRVLVINEAVCGTCGSPVESCECRVRNVDEQNFAAFGLPSEYVAEDGSFFGGAEPEPCDDCPEEHFAPFGLPGEYLGDK